MREAFKFGLAGLFLLAGCNSVKSEDLPSAANDPKTAEIAGQLNEEDKKLFAAYLIRREMLKNFGGGQVMADGSKTVGDAIDAQKKWMSDMTESQQKAELLKAEVAEKRKLVADQIAKSVTVAFISANFKPSNWQEDRTDDIERFSFVVQNNGNAAIKALKGQAEFIDTFGEVYVSVPMQFEDLVAPGEKKEIELAMEINKYMDEHKKIMNIDDTKKFRFIPEQIVFSDGRTLKAPPEAE